MQYSERQLREILQPGGVLSKVLEPYEPRPQQYDLGRAVGEALAYGRILIAEAPTGVGKTLAYLIPAAIHARATHEPVVISSYSRTLQDQVLEQEVPRLRRIVHPDLAVAVLKGRGNYLCRRRWDLFVAEDGSGAQGRQVVERLAPWVASTQTGDLSEAPDVGRREAWALARIAGDARFCRSRECRPETGCFHKLARRNARQADLVIVNHSLLLAHALTGGVLPDFRALIVDEAHALPDAALEPLTWRIRERGFEDRVRLMGGSGEPGYSDRLRAAVRLLPSKVAQQNMQKRLQALEEQSRRALEDTRTFFAALAAGPHFPRAGERRRYRQADCDQGLVPNELDPLLGALETLLRDARDLARRLEAEWPGEGPSREARDLLDAAESARADLAEATEVLKALLAPNDETRVYMAEGTGRGGVGLAAVPLDTGPALREHIVLPQEGVVFTSATLGAADEFGYFCRQVGVEAPEVVALELTSPFDLKRQLRLVVPTYAPDPREGDYARFLASAIARLLGKARRKALVLFTAYQTLREVEALLQSERALDGVAILAQTRETSRSRLMEQFRAAKAGVLLGTASFWQGVDFPGEELEMLIVTRLPFPVPSDPRAEAIGEELEREGRSGFFEYALPEAILKLRQGVGRLIRRADDRGLCVILDARIVRARYGSRFRGALPVPVETVENEEELMRLVAEWARGDTRRGRA